MKRWIPISLWIAGQIACTRPVPDQEVFPDLAFVGPGFSKGVIPRKNSCDAGDTSPALSWKGSPANIRSFAVIATDIDSPLQSIKGPFVHWLLYGIPADKRDLPEGIPGQLSCRMVRVRGRMASTRSATAAHVLPARLRIDICLTCTRSMRR